MSDDEDALLQRALPRNLVERKRAIAVRAAEEAAKLNCTEKSIYDLIYTIGLCNSIKKEFPMSYKILAGLFAEKYPVDETQPDKIKGITDLAIRRNPISIYFDNIGETYNECFEVHTLKGTVEDSISWLACFEGAATHRAKLISAMKLAVHSHPVNLEKGKESWSPANKFIEEQELVPVLFTKNQFHQWIFREEDAAFRDAWLAYYEGKLMPACYKCQPEMRNRLDADGWSVV
jgi:hypothetical protein